MRERERETYCRISIGKVLPGLLVQPCRDIGDLEEFLSWEAWKDRFVAAFLQIRRSYVRERERV